MPIDVRSRLLNAEEDFIDSFDEGTSSALEGFRDSWSMLVDSLQTQSLDPETTNLAHAAASRVEVLASAFLDIHTGINALKTNFMADLENILGQLCLNDIVNSPPRQKPPTPLQQTTCPQYVAPAYKWLLKNIHNPYPSKEAKELISKGTGTSVQHVDAWFLNTRRRIGWTSLSKKYYSGSKTETVEAAYRALVKDDPKRPLEANIRMAFIEMEAAAKELYSEKFHKSALAGKLDGMVKDMTDEDKARRAADKAKAVEEAKLKGEREKLERKQQAAARRWAEAEVALSSPTHSPRRFSTPISVTEEDDEDLTPPPPIAGRKRQSSDSEENADRTSSHRPMKRSKLSQSSSLGSILSSDSSAASEDDLPSTPPPSTNVEQTSTKPAQSRKRRLSDAGADITPKRPCHAPCRAVSDPLPRSVAAEESPASIFDWCSQFFDTPSTAVIDELDPSLPLDLEVYDYSSSGEGTLFEFHEQKLFGKELGSSSASPVVNPSLGEIDSILPDFSSYLNALNWPYIANNDEFNPPIDPQLLSFSVPTATPAASSNTTPPISVPLNDSFEPPSTDNQLNKLDDFSSLISLPSNSQFQDTTPTSAVFDAVAAIDWAQIIPQPVATFDSTATLTTPTATAFNVAVDSRAEKLRKYQEHIAQARQLEAELALA